MNACSMKELTKFISSLDKIEPIADFGGGRTTQRIKKFLEGFNIHKHRVYDLGGDDFLMDLTKEIVKEKYQTIMCVDTLEHTINPFKVAQNIARALLPGGKAFVSAPFMWEKHGDDYFRFSIRGLWALFEGTDVELIKAYEMPDGDRIRATIIVEKL